MGVVLLRTLKDGVAQVKILRQRYPAAMHLGIFWGMALLFVGTVLGSLDTDVFELIFNTKLLQGNLYLLEKVVLDLAALFVLVGLGLAVYRRYVIVKPDRLNTDWRFNFTLPLLAFIILTGLFARMSTEIIMPQFGESVVEGTVSRWLIAEGEPVRQDQPLLQITTDKVDTELPAPASGILLKILVPEGQTVAKGTVLGVIGDQESGIRSQGSGVREQESGTVARRRWVLSRRWLAVLLVNSASI